MWNPWDNKLYNCAAIIQKGQIHRLIPKTHIPSYGEFYETRWFASGKDRHSSGRAKTFTPCAAASFIRAMICSAL